MIIDALKGKYALPILPAYFHMAKSSYYYQQAVRNKPDKYFPLREQIVSVFHDNRGVYGYRRYSSVTEEKWYNPVWKSDPTYYERRKPGDSQT